MTQWCRMLRLPISKIYRAFPELDRFSDERCEEYVRQARRELGYMIWFVSIVSAGVMAVVVVSALVLIVNLFRVFVSGVDPALLFPMAVGCLIGIPLLSGLLARDLVLGRFLRRYVRSKIERSRCPACKYSLLGQRMSKGVIRCPECGGTTTLQALGLQSPDDLMPPSSPADELLPEEP